MYLFILLKVTVILEILIRKCGYAAIEGFTPDNYKGFIKPLGEVNLSSLM